MVAVVGACDETLEGGLACPALCVAPTATVLDTTLLPVVEDSTLAGFPAIGEEQEILLSARGDTVDTRAIIRFDTLRTTYPAPTTGVDTPVTMVDSAVLMLSVTHADTLGPPITFEAYDVDTLAGDDTATATLLPLFTPSRFLGSRTYPADSLYKDTLRIPIDNAKLLARIQATDGPHRLRVGVRITAPTSAEVRIATQNGTFGQYLRYRVSPDTSFDPEVQVAYSSTPALKTLASDLADFLIVAKSPPAEPPGVLRVGGIPGKRVYMRFNIPSAILDSSSIIRAQLLLTQRPVPAAPEANDSSGVEPFAVAAGAAITDIRRLMQFLEGAQDSVRVVPSDSRVVPFEIMGLLRAWRGTSPEKTPRAVALRGTAEGLTAWFADFYSSEADQALRPRLRITYVPKTVPELR